MNSEQLRGSVYWKTDSLNRTVSFSIQSSEFSKIPVEPYLFDWNISSEVLETSSQGPSSIPNQGNNTVLNELGYLSSPTFRANGVNSVTEWVVQMSTRHTEPDGTRYLSIFLLFKGSQGLTPELTGTEAQVLYSFQIMTGNDKTCFSKQSRIRNFDSTLPDKNCYGWIRFLPLNKLGTLTVPVPVFSIRLNLWVMDPISLSVVRNSLAEEEGEGEPMDVSGVVEVDQRTFTPSISMDSDAESFSGDMDTSSYKSSSNDEDTSKRGGLDMNSIKNMIKNLWTTKRLWDLEVKTPDMSFQAHTSILTARSNLLAKELLLLPLNEHSRRVYTLEGFDSELVNQILEFSYTSETTGFQDFRRTLGLYRAAVKLEMRALKTRALEELVRVDRLTDSNVAAVINVLNDIPPDLREAHASLKVLGEYVWKNLPQLKGRVDLKDLLSLGESQEYEPGKHGFIKTILFDTL